MQSIINDMFNDASAGPPTAVDTQDRFGFSGGYAEIRSPIQDVNLVSFVPPNISGGCGGINLFLGSFSFVNGQEFETLLRDIGQNAIGYAFKLAIENMCPSCESVLNDLQDAIQGMNSALKNSCQLSEGLVNWAAGQNPNAGEISQQLQGAWQATQNIVPDVFSAFQNLTGNPSSSTQTAAAQNASSPSTSPSLVANPLVGNMTWKALQQNGAISILQGIGTSDTTSQELLMSLIGTTIIEPEPSSQESQNCTNAQTGCEGQTHSFNHTLDLDALVNGPADTQTTGTGGYYLQCTAFQGQDGTNYPATGQALSCLNVTPALLSSTGFQGIRATVDALLFGGHPGAYLNSDPSLQATNGTIGGIVGFVEGGTPMTGPVESAFIQQIPVSLYTDLLEVQHDPAEVTAIAKAFEPYIVALYAMQLGQAVITTAESTFQGTSDVTPPADLDATLAALKTDVNKYAQTANQIWAQQAAIIESIKAERAAMLVTDH